MLFKISFRKQQWVHLGKLITDIVALVKFAVVFIGQPVVFVSRVGFFIWIIIAIIILSYAGRQYELFLVLPLVLTIFVIFFAIPL